VIILFITLLFNCTSGFANDFEKVSSMEIGKLNWKIGDEWIVDCGKNNILHFKVINKEIAKFGDKRVDGENC